MGIEQLSASSCEPTAASSADDDDDASQSSIEPAPIVSMLDRIAVRETTSMLLPTDEDDTEARLLPVPSMLTVPPVGYITMYHIDG